MANLGPGGYLFEGSKVKKKYEADDGDIKPITLQGGDDVWAGANPEPAGAINDRDSARGTGSSRRKLGERARFATFSASIEVTDTGANFTVTKIVTKKIPVLTRAAFGVAPFAVGATLPGKVYDIFFDPNPNLVSKDVTWTCTGLTPESNR